MSATSEVSESPNPERPAVVGPDVIRSVVRNAPNKPGVYRMLDAEGEVLYVGKAKNVKKRVQSYTRLMGQTNRIARMIALTADMEIITTASEAEALLLEANLIKKLKPRYNINFRDDKSFPYILISREHRVSQVVKHRGRATVTASISGRLHQRVQSTARSTRCNGRF